MTLSKNDNSLRDKIMSNIYREVDGFYYYDPPYSGGGYSAHILRDVANILDEMNKPWIEQIERDLKPNK